MRAPAYAALADVAAWQGLTLPDGVTGDPAQLPAGATAALRSAIAAVRDATVTWIYAPDPVTGLPTNPDLAAALHDATCIQATALLALEVDPTAGGTLDATVESSAGIGSARVTIAGADQAAASRAATIAGLCPDAARELRLAGAFAAVWVAG